MFALPIPLPIKIRPNIYTQMCIYLVEFYKPKKNKQNTHANKNPKKTEHTNITHYAPVFMVALSTATIPSSLLKTG